MRQPLWAINSSLLFLFLLGQLVLFILKAPIPRRASLEPDIIKPLEKKTAIVIDNSKIYGPNDLFGTYTTPTPTQAKAVEPEIPTIPDVPALIPLSIPVQVPKVFIPPLPVTLKGVIYLNDRPAQSLAIVQFQDSKEEINYRVGQLINDAQILKIFPNRIIVVRSNGQQETLYLRDHDASKDFAKEMSKDVSSLSIQFKNGAYHIPVEKFVSQVKSLGGFIDLLDITTVYKKGKTVGCRIGKADKNSLGSKLGFVYDDIITQVDGLPVTDIASRVLVFDHLIEKTIGDKIHVKVERSGKPIDLHYTLIKNQHDGVVSLNTLPGKETKDNEQPSVPVKEKTKMHTQETPFELEKQRQKMFEQKVKMAPTAHQIEMEERKKMFEARRREMLANRSTPTQNMSASDRKAAVENRRRGL